MSALWLHFYIVLWDLDSCLVFVNGDSNSTAFSNVRALYWSAYMPCLASQIQETTLAIGDIRVLLHTITNFFRSYMFSDVCRRMPVDGSPSWNYQINWYQGTSSA